MSLLFAWLLPLQSSAQDWKHALRAAVETPDGVQHDGQIVAADSGALYVALNSQNLKDIPVDYPVIRFPFGQIMRLKVEGKLRAKAPIWVAAGTLPLFIWSVQLFELFEGSGLGPGSLILGGVLGSIWGQYAYRKKINLLYEFRGEEDTYLRHLWDLKRYAKERKIPIEEVLEVARDWTLENAPSFSFTSSPDLSPAMSQAYLNPDYVRLLEVNAYIFQTMTRFGGRHASGGGGLIKFRINPNWHIGLAGDDNRITAGEFFGFPDDFFVFSSSFFEKKALYTHLTYYPFPFKERFRYRLYPYGRVLIGAHHFKGYHAYNTRLGDDEDEVAQVDRPTSLQAAMGLEAGLELYLWRALSLSAWARANYDSGFELPDGQLAHPIQGNSLVLPAPRMTGSGATIGFGLSFHL